ncbi:MAG: response regulator transcription factor [Acidobacteria bacterium]|nr:response regulator transcription factor [Acidobacteriota bacterium]
MIQVLMADDHSLIRQGLRLLLEDQADMTVVGEARDGREAIDKTLELKPDVLILDIAMPVLGGLEAAREIAHHRPRTRILGLSVRRDAAYAREMLRAGAYGYLTKEASQDELLSAIRAVRDGETVVSRLLSTGLTRDGRPGVTSPVERLTVREREILRRIAEGATNKDIASELSLSVHTVDAHRGNIMKKLDLHSSGEIVRFAVRHELTD